MEPTTQNTQTIAGAYAEDRGLAKAASPSPLAQLLDTQEKTAHLLGVLQDKLSPVSNPHPVDSKERADRGYHVETALYNQRAINEAISYIIDTVVV